MTTELMKISKYLIQTKKNKTETQNLGWAKMKKTETDGIQVILKNSGQLFFDFVSVFTKTYVTS